MKEEILKKVREIIDIKFDSIDVDYIPEITDRNLTFLNKGIYFNAAVLYIDMRDSTKVLNMHKKHVVAKIHKSYLYTTVQIAKSLGGEVRSFNGDSILVFFPGSAKVRINNAVRAAMQIRYMIGTENEGINALLKQYSAVNFGIGVDDGRILCVKVGVGGDENTKDLIWLGNAINKSVIISDKCCSPQFIGISQWVFENIDDSIKYGVRDILGTKLREQIWNIKSIEYNKNYENYYTSSWQITVN